MASAAWAISVAVMVVGFFYFMGQAGSETRRQQTELAVVCIQNGGSWLNGFAGPYCERGTK